jgi:UTP:GlnB (protein PII) uridylyltransferase
MSGAPAATPLEDARRSVGRDILSGESGLSALGRYTAHVDRELQRIYAAAEPVEGGVALVALGGYGRRHLCPYSDIDLLLLFGAPVGGGGERFLRHLLHPLWDAGFVVGHQVREAAELETPEVATRPTSRARGRWCSTRSSGCSTSGTRDSTARSTSSSPT